MADSKKYDGSTWEHSLRKMTTATAEIEPTIYTDGTAITSYTIKGNTVQNGTPTPSNPVPVVGVGELETTGEHSGEYKIPILNGQGSAVNYLGSVQSNRQIQKLVLDGNEESWSRSTSYLGGFFSSWSNFGGMNYGAIYCSHAQYVSVIADYVSGTCYSDGSLNIRIMPEGSTVTQWREYLAQQYANGTPVTVWYILQTATTGTVNEPLMKIGTYADSISNATAIPTTDGANSITVDTTVQPSEFTATWTGWHDSSVKEWDGSQWE